MDEQQLTAALNGAFDSPAAPAAPAKPAAAPPEDPNLPREGEVAQNTAEADAVAAKALGEPTEAERDAALEAEEAAKAAEAGEPAFEVVVDGEAHVVKGEEAIKATLQKGLDYERKMNYTAQVRDSLMAQARAMQATQKFTAEISTDMLEMQNLTAQLAQFDRLNWQEMWQKDPFQAMQLKDQRDQLRELRNVKGQQLSVRQQQFQEGQAQAAHEVLAAETQALLAKVPEWRDHQKATQGRAEIWRTLREYGFNDNELSALNDHRMVHVMRDFVRLKSASASAAGKRVTEAPPVVKPGAVASVVKQQGAVQYRNAIREVRALGRKGDAKAQEALTTKMLERTFK